MSICKISIGLLLTKMEISNFPPKTLWRRIEKSAAKILWMLHRSIPIDWIPNIPKTECYSTIRAFYFTLCQDENHRCTQCYSIWFELAFLFFSFIWTFVKVLFFSIKIFSGIYCKIMHWYCYCSSHILNVVAIVRNFLFIVHGIVDSHRRRCSRRII